MNTETLGLLVFGVATCVTLWSLWGELVRTNARAPAPHQDGWTGLASGRARVIRERHAADMFQAYAAPLRTLHTPHTSEEG